MPFGLWRKEEAQQRVRRVSTAVDMEAPMWLLHISDFMRMQRLESHGKLRASRKLVEWDASMETVFFFSHQWTSFEHPDPTCDQLRTLQRVFVRMSDGKFPTVKPGFADKLTLGKTVAIDGDEWVRLVGDAYIWIDFASIPQTGPNQRFGIITFEAKPSLCPGLARHSLWRVLCRTLESQPGLAVSLKPHSLPLARPSPLASPPESQPKPRLWWLWEPQLWTAGLELLKIQRLSFPR